tara:strand:+ start:130 stop:534 length:405 start_codon:yes stop_codon:yes gene_type:complete
MDAYADEGLQFKAIKIIDRGQPNQLVWHIRPDNVRVSDLVAGDMQAQIAAARIGVQRLMRQAIARDPQDVADDVADGLISPASAKAGYGVGHWRGWSDCPGGHCNGPVKNRLNVKGPPVFDPPTQNFRSLLSRP